MLRGLVRSSSCSYLASAWRLILLFVVVLMNPFEVKAQPVTYYPWGVTTPDPQGFVRAFPPAECTVDGVAVGSSMPDGTFGKIGTSLRVDAAASISGWCDIYIWGQYYRTETRNINAVHVTTLPPIGDGNILNITPNTWTQSLDSRNVGTTSGAVPGLLQHEGRYRFDIQTRAMPTACQIPMFSNVVEKLVFATDCRPQWLTENGNMLRPPPGDVRFNIPPELAPFQPIAEAAATDLYASLGVRIIVTVGQPCAGYGARCVTFRDTYPSPPNNQRPRGCADHSGGGVWPTGLRAGPWLIRFRSDWYEADFERNQRRLAHEFLHYFGLDNRQTSGCNQNNTIMRPADAVTTDWCNDPNPLPATVPRGPTDNDRNALVGPTYPTQNRRICGFPPIP